MPNLDKRTECIINFIQDPTAENPQIINGVSYRVNCNSGVPKEIISDAAKDAGRYGTPKEITITKLFKGPEPYKGALSKLIGNPFDDTAVYEENEKQRRRRLQFGRKFEG